MHGLNQGLVDGVVEPDRWTIDRHDATLLAHHSAERREMVTAAKDGVRLVPLPVHRRGTPPLAPGEISRVHGLAERAEGSFGAPQDVEWTLRRDELYALQSRPITTLTGEAGDGRAVYLSLRRSYDSLQRLRRRIEEDDIPALVAAADRLAATPLASLSDDGLCAALLERKAAHELGVDVYTADFIPFAHGARLFGRAYNDVLHPEDPYEFTDLLTATPMLAFAATPRWSGLPPACSTGKEARRAGARRVPCRTRRRRRRWRHCCPGPASRLPATATVEVLALARRLSRRPTGRAPARPDPADRAKRFIEAHPEAERERAAELLELGRVSWRLRDDDNLYLGRLERLLTAALQEALRRGMQIDDDLRPREVTLPSPLGAATPAGGPGRLHPPVTAPPDGVRRQARQIVGQPAGPGLAVGAARVVRCRDDLSAFEDGEILVCDAIESPIDLRRAPGRGHRGAPGRHADPRRHHRPPEYGLPCVTGVPSATELIRTGDRLTVDGYLGIVVIG